MILGAKIHAIRDAQILEKGQIQKEMKVEEKRLDQMMELDRLNAIKIDEEIERKRKDEKLIGAMKIMEQIQENEQVSWSEAYVANEQVNISPVNWGLKAVLKCMYRNAC